MAQQVRYEVILSYLYDEKPQVVIRWQVRLFRYDETANGFSMHEIQLVEHMRGAAFFDVFEQALEKAQELKAAYCPASGR